MLDAQITLLDIDITTAVSITAAPSSFVLENWINTLLLEANFVYGSGGTSAKAYVQTSIDGENWTDIASFAFTTASAKKTANLSSKTAVTTVYTPTDGTLTDNTVKDGVIGNRLRVKYVTVGTYASTSLTVIAYARG